MGTVELRTYAINAAQRVSHLEGIVAALEAERRQKSADQVRQSRQMHESATLRELQLREALDRAQQELEVERSVRRDYEGTVQRMRGLCRTAKERLQAALTHRDRLLQDLASRDDELSTLRDQVYDRQMLVDDLTDRCRRLQAELDRERQRQAELEACLRRGDDVRALHILTDVFRTVCSRIESQAPPECSSSTTPILSSPPPPSDWSPAEQQLTTVAPSPSLVADAVTQLVRTSVPATAVVTLRHISDLTSLAEKATSDAGLPVPHALPSDSTVCSISDIVDDITSPTVTSSQSPKHDKEQPPQNLVETKKRPTKRRQRQSKEPKGLRVLRRRLGPPPTRLRVTDA